MTRPPISYPASFFPTIMWPKNPVTLTILSRLFYSPILFCPSTEFLPHGLFPAIVVKLSQNTIWSLDECERFRNRIRFYVQYSKEKLLHVELRTLSTHLEFRIVQTDTPVNPRLIPLVRQELWDAITEVSLSYQHTKKRQVEICVLLSFCCELRWSPSSCKVQDNGGTTRCSVFSA